MTNADFEAIVDTSDEWIRERTGIRQRHIVADGQTTCDLAEAAARQALKRAGLVGADIDLIVVGTTTSDLIFPSTACLLQSRLGAEGCTAFDVNAACSSFLYALGVADKFVRNGSAKKALVVGAETLTRMLDWSDRSTCVLFGDGAGAVVLTPDTQTGVLATHLHANGSQADYLHSTTGVSAGLTAVDNGGVRVQMKGNEVFKVAVRTLEKVASETLAAAGVEQSELDWLVPHQANIRIIKATSKRLGLDDDRVIITVDRHGNTSAASVPLALDEAVGDGRIKRGELLLLEAFGGGFTWGSALLRF